jgi:uncharacterized protein
MGHENVKALHRTTLEFTKEDFLTPSGDCILGICADFGRPCAFEGPIRISITCDGIMDELTAIANPRFDSDSMVIRKSNFIDKRTFATGSSKAACDIERSLVHRMNKRDTVALVEITQA